MPSHVIGLKDLFDSTSDPYHFFESQTHSHALKRLSDAVEERRNIRVLVGEPGTGKTALLLSLLRRLPPTVFTAHLFWTQLRGSEFLQYLLHEFGVSWPPAGIAEAQKLLNGALEQRFLGGQTVAVVIDEAHELDIPTLRAVAELLDCPAGRSKRLQIILAGLPSLDSKLRSPALRPISDRISTVTWLNRLTFEESASYIRRRLNLAGFGSDQAFTDDAIVLIAKLGHGIPREINNICFAAAYRAEQRSRSPIDAGTVLDLEALAEEARIMAPAEVPQASSARVSLPFWHPQSPPKISWGEDAGQREIGVDGAGPVVNPTTLCSGASEAFSNFISEWFGYERLAWCGTAGELATCLQQSEEGLVQVIHSSSDALRSLGIELSTVESWGRTASVSLRARESRKKAKAEPAAAEPVLLWPPPVPAAEAGVGAALKDHDLPPFQSSRQLAQEAAIDGLPTDPVPASDLDENLEALVRSQPKPILEPPSSRFRHWMVPALFAMLALGIAIAMARNSLLSWQCFRMHAGQRATPSLSRNPAVAREIRGAVAKDGRTNVASDSGPEAGITQPTDASSSLLRAARSGNPEAQFELGTDYAAGRGVREDTITGYIWLTLAFANGNKQAERLIRQLTPTLNPTEIAQIRWNLGEMYADGIGVRPDKVTAYMWHLLAELAGETRSRNAKARLAHNMTADQISEAQARASEWLRKHQQPAKKASLPAA